MIKAVIFDCFGVLTTEGWLAFKNQYFGDDPEKMQQASDISRQLDRGYISYQQGLDQIAALAGVTSEELNTVLTDNVVDRSLIDYILIELKPNYKIGMLSNVRKNWVEKVFTEKDLSLFDALCLSNETGVVKPDSRAYIAAAAGLDIEPQEAVFIDDITANISGAEAVGMRGIVYQNLAQLKAELGTILAADSKD